MNTDSIKEIVNVSSGDINNIKQLKINRFDIDGEIINVDMKDLLNFKNLERLSLNNLTISEYDMSILVSLDKLNELELNDCEVENSEILMHLSIKRLILNNTFVNSSIFNKRYEFVKIKNMNINYIVDTETLDIHQSDMDILNNDFSSVSCLIMSPKQMKIYGNNFKDNYPYIKVKIMNEYDEEVKYE